MRFASSDSATPMLARSAFAVAPPSMLASATSGASIVGTGDHFSEIGPFSETSRPVARITAAWMRGFQLFALKVTIKMLIATIGGPTTRPRTIRQILRQRIEIFPIVPAAPARGSRVLRCRLNGSDSLLVQDDLDGTVVGKRRPRHDESLGSLVTCTMPERHRRRSRCNRAGSSVRDNSDLQLSSLSSAGAGFMLRIMASTLASRAQTMVVHRLHHRSGGAWRPQLLWAACLRKYVASWRVI